MTASGHLPRLKRPPGWVALDAGAVRNRAAQVYLAYQDSLGAAQCPTGGSAGAGSPGYRDGASEWDSRQGASAQALAASPLGGARGNPGSGQERSALRWMIPWALVFAGIALAPWIVWAPMVGGLSAAVLWLQAGQLQRWSRTAAPGAVHAEAPFAAPEYRAALQQEHKGPDTAWLLLAILILLTALAVMLITTLKVQGEGPAATAQRLPGGQRDRAELMRKLEDRKALQALPYSPGQALNQDAPVAPEASVSDARGADPE